jgi:apolipoprotein N-acyltransferase
MVNVAFASIFFKIPLKKGKKYLLAITASLFLFSLVYGYLTITNTITGSKVNISLVQGNIEQKKKWDPKYAREIMQIYAELTEEVSKDQPQMIIWPETATPGSISINPRLYIDLMGIVKKAETSFLVGSAQQQKFEGKGPVEFKFSNSAFLIHPVSGLAKKKYDKIRLFPFGEYLPYKNIIPWSLINVRESGNYTEGREFTVFQTPDLRFGTIICWENLFPDLVRQFVKRRAQFIVNLTNEAHFAKTAAPHQLLSMSVFRAVENKVYVVRCANTGVSCIIDPYGRIVDRIKDDKGEDIFIRGTLTGYIIPMESNTIYTQYGDVLVWVALIVSITSIVFTAVTGLNST